MMKKLVFINNNMKTGGVQKSLLNLLWAIRYKYDLTLYLFKADGEYINMLPPEVKVKECNSLFKYLGISQSDCNNIKDQLIRGFLAASCKALGRSFVLKIMLLTQPTIEEHYDYAISYLHNGAPHLFYGGVNEFTLYKINAKRKITYLHCDYRKCGSDTPENNRLYKKFDRIAACSEGCRRAFLEVIPDLSGKCQTATNFHCYEEIKKIAYTDPVLYEKDKINVLCVGRLAHEKGFDRAIYALAYCCKKNHHIKLHFVGDGPMETELRELVNNLGLSESVQFYGIQENPYKFMVNADILLLTSYHEAAPMVIDEARSLSLPVLSVETTSAKEMIIDKQCGWVCLNNQEALNKSLLYLVENWEQVQITKQRLKNLSPNNKEAMEEFSNLLKDYVE